MTSLVASMETEYIRTLRNYLYRALDILATHFQCSDLGIFDELQDGTSRYSSEDTSSRSLTQQYIEREYAYLPSAFGYSNPASTFIERSVRVRSLRGDAIPNQIITTTSDFPCVSGVLAGEAGSGRSSYMRQIVLNMAGESISSGESVLAFYIHAPEFCEYARNRISVYNFIGDRVFSSTENEKNDIVSFVDWLRKLDNAGKLLLLVDDLDRMSVVNQHEVFGQFVFSNKVIFSALPWQVNSIIKKMKQASLVRFDLLDLDVAHKQQMLARFIDTSQVPDIDLDLAFSILESLPDLAKLPLGIMAIAEQISVGETTYARVTQNFVYEVIARTNSVTDSSKDTDETSSSLFELLARFAGYLGDEISRRIGNMQWDCNLDEMYRSSDYMYGEHITNGQRDDLRACRLMHPVEGSNNFQFANRDVMAYFIAEGTHTWWRNYSQFQIDKFPLDMDALMKRIHQYWE